MATSGMRIEHVIVGVGLNVGASDLPDELRTIATSLRRVTGRSWDRAEVLARVLAALEQRYESFVADGPAATVRAWKQEAGIVGTRVTLRGGDQHHTGVVEDLDDDGALRLRDDAGQLHRLWAGDLEPAS
jgi:BirA family biotin operon repressor/biotin-[acetyl-CoA-carboxylase] ligase